MEILYDRLEVVRLLLDYCGNLKILDTEGKTPLHLACLRGSLEMSLTHKRRNLYEGLKQLSTYTRRVYRYPAYNAYPLRSQSTKLRQNFSTHSSNQSNVLKGGTITQKRQAQANMYKLSICPCSSCAFPSWPPSRQRIRFRRW